MSLTHFATEAELVLAYVVGNDVRQHPGNVITPRGISDSHLLKAADRHAGSTQDRLPVNERVRTGEQAHGVSVEAVVRIVKCLVEVIYAKQNLVGHAGR